MQIYMRINADMRWYTIRRCLLDAILFSFHFSIICHPTPPSPHLNNTTSICHRRVIISAQLCQAVDDSLLGPNQERDSLISVDARNEVLEYQCFQDVQCSMIEPDLDELSVFQALDDDLSSGADDQNRIIYPVCQHLNTSNRRAEVVLLVYIVQSQFGKTVSALFFIVCGVCK